MYQKTQAQSILLTSFGQFVLLEPPFLCQIREICTYDIANAKKKKKKKKNSREMHRWTNDIDSPEDFYTFENVISLCSDCCM